jgi:hypothetical protein
MQQVCYSRGICCDVQQHLVQLGKAAVSGGLWVEDLPRICRHQGRNIHRRAHGGAEDCPDPATKEAVANCMAAECRGLLLWPLTCGGGITCCPAG